MSGFARIISNVVDASKVRLGGVAPALKTADTSKVRMGGCAPALKTADASKVRVG